MTLSKDIVQKLRKKHGDNKVILSLEEKGFCVAVMKNGETRDYEARDINEFLIRTKSSDVAWVDYIVDDLHEGANKAALAFGFSEQLLSPLLKSDRADYFDLDNELGLLIPAIIVKGFDVKVNYLLVLMRKNLVVTIHTTEVKRFIRIRRYAKIFMRKIKPNLSPEDKLTMILTRIIDENNARNFDHLREIERNSDDLSSKLASMSTNRQEIGQEIHLMKHALIEYLNGLWETVDVLNTLRYGDPELLSDDPLLLQRIGALVSEVNGQIGLAEHMSDVLASGLEVIQSIYNNQLQILNNRLALLVAYLTIIGTALIVPNTIATIFGTPFFTNVVSEADMGWYISLMLASTVISAIGAWAFVKYMGLLPKSADTD
ncbi:MAG: CorA family divalent cation transporter [Candidatus Micrarchaeota archaeon]